MEKEKWMIISWQYDYQMYGSYGKFLGSVIGTEEEAKTQARNLVPTYSPIGIMQIINK